MNNNSNMLIIKKKSIFGNNKFIVCDNFKNKLYNVLINKSEGILLFNNKEIAKIVYSKNNNEIIYNVYLDKLKTGDIKKNISVKPIYESQFNGWRIEGNLLHDQYNVFDIYNNNIVIINAPTKNEYIISFNDQSNEKMALVIAIMIELEKRN